LSGWPPQPRLVPEGPNRPTEVAERELSNLKNSLQAHESRGRERIRFDGTLRASKTLDRRLFLGSTRQPFRGSSRTNPANGTTTAGVTHRAMARLPPESEAPGDELPISP